MCKYISQIFIVTICYLVMFVTPVVSKTFKDWETAYVEGDESGALSSCFASVNYTNAWFATRLHDESLDFIFYRKDFTLPYDKVLGKLIFQIDSVSFLLFGGTIAKKKTDILDTAQTLFIYADKKDYGNLFNALKNGKSFTIKFPNGDSYPISLRGSSAALSFISECWKNRPTGPWSNNPFIGNKKANNPFDDT